jgi:hypothetical protein
MKDYYSILGVDRDASEITIKKTFREKALLIHPDKSKTDTEEKFIELYEAYSILADRKKRDKYDNLYNFFNPESLVNEDKLDIDLIAISEKGKIYAENYNKFDREIMVMILLEVFLGSKFAFATLACVFFGVWTILKGIINFQLDYVMIGFLLTIFGLSLGIINFNRIKREY